MGHWKLATETIVGDGDTEDSSHRNATWEWLEGVEPLAFLLLLVTQWFGCYHIALHCAAFYWTCLNRTGLNWTGLPYPSVLVKQY